MNYFTLNSTKELMQRRKYFEGNGCFSIADFLPSSVRGQCHCLALTMEGWDVPKGNLANELKEPPWFQC